GAGPGGGAERRRRGACRGAPARRRVRGQARPLRRRRQGVRGRRRREGRRGRGPLPGARRPRAGARAAQGPARRPHRVRVGRSREPGRDAARLGARARPVRQEPTRATADLPPFPPATIVAPWPSKPTAALAQPAPLACVGAFFGVAAAALECGQARIAKAEYDDAAKALEQAARSGEEKDVVLEARYW